MSDLLIRVEIFEWTSPEEDLTLFFPVTELLFDMSDARSRLPYTELTTYLDPDYARDWVSKRDIKGGRVNHILANPARYNEPVLGARFPDADNSVILIDGSHRYIARYIRGEETIVYRILEYKDWKPYVKVVKGSLP